MDINNAIEVRNMSKSFKLIFDKPQTLKERLVFWHKSEVEYHQVLKDISLNIKKGETVALIGTNGSGKSTLLKLMTKILYPNAGTLTTQGKLTSLLELGAGFHPDFSGRENIYFNAAIFGLTKKEIELRIDQIIEFSELKDFIDNPVRTYSSGMYMRLAFSIAINVDAEILLIDEILAVGDQYFQDKCFAKLQELRKSDKTIVIVSHSLDTIKKLCDRVIWIYKGTLKMDGAPEEIIDNYLEQIVIDHQKEGVKITKTKDYEGELYIDLPAKGTCLARDEDSLRIEGWELSETTQSRVKVLLNGSEIEHVKRKVRLDLYAVFEDKFGGYGTNPLAGWICSADLSKLDSGAHTIEVIVYDEHGEIIKRMIRKFEIEK